MSDENEFHVKAVLFIHSPNPILKRFDRGPMGYLPMIFCPTRHERSRILMSALDDVDITWKDPEPSEVYGTPEEAMDAYEKAEPMQIPHATIGRNNLIDEVVNEILERGLYRKLSQSESTVDEESEWDF